MHFKAGIDYGFYKKKAYKVQQIKETGRE